MRFIDITGQRFGRLQVLSRTGATAERGATWLCVCDCGTTKEISAKCLRAGHTQSCGCLGKERRAAATSVAKATHGHTRVAGKSRTYRIWTNMRSRCQNPNFNSFKWYGGRGIKVCDRWQKFENFLADMGEAPDGLTLDRVDTNGDYEPSNCRWITQAEQATNTRSVRLIEWNGETHSMSEWARRYGMSTGAFAYRLSKGWSVDRALSEPVK